MYIGGSLFMPVLTAYEPTRIIVDTEDKEEATAKQWTQQDAYKSLDVVKKDKIFENEREKPEQSEQNVLVSRALHGDQSAFSTIVDQYGSLMLHTAVMIVGDHDVAEDVVQDAFIQAWYHLHHLREAS